MRNLVKSFVADESGATVIEYGLIMSFIAIAIIAILTVMGVNLNGVFQVVLAGFK